MWTTERLQKDWRMLWMWAKAVIPRQICRNSTQRIPTAAGVQVSAGLQVTGSSQNRIVYSKSWQFSVGSHPTLFKSLERFLLASVWRLLLPYTLALGRARLQNACGALPSQGSGQDFELLVALPFPCTFGRQESPAKAVRHSGRQQTPAWASAKPNKRPAVLHREAGLHMGLAKPGKSLGTLEGSKAPCRAKQNWAKAPGHYGEKQSPLWEKQKQSDRVRWLLLGVGLGMGLELGLGFVVWFGVWS